MANDYDRLLLAAKELHGCEDAASTSRFLSIYDQLLTNWRNRGIPKERIMDLAQALGCDPYWLRDGVGPMRPSIDPEVYQILSSHPEFGRLIKAAEPLKDYQVEVLVQTSLALSKQETDSKGRQ